MASAVPANNTAVGRPAMRSRHGPPVIRRTTVRRPGSRRTAGRSTPGGPEVVGGSAGAGGATGVVGHHRRRSAPPGRRSTAAPRRRTRAGRRWASAATTIAGRARRARRAATSTAQLPRKPESILWACRTAGRASTAAARSPAVIGIEMPRPEIDDDGRDRPRPLARSPSRGRRVVAHRRPRDHQHRPVDASIGDRGGDLERAGAIVGGDQQVEHLRDSSRSARSGSAGSGRSPRCRTRLGYGPGPMTVLANQVDPRREGVSGQPGVAARTAGRARPPTRAGQPGRRREVHRPSPSARQVAVPRAGRAPGRPGQPAARTVPAGRLGHRFPGRRRRVHRHRGRRGHRVRHHRQRPDGAGRHLDHGDGHQDPAGDGDRPGEPAAADLPRRVRRCRPPPPGRDLRARRSELP